MAKLTEAVKAVIEKGTPVVATCGRFGFPNVTPKGSVRVHDDETLVFSENAGGKTYYNLHDNPSVSVLVMDLENRTGYQIKGNVEISDAGDLYADAVRRAEARGGRSPKYVVVVHVAEVWSIWPGQTDQPVIN